MEDPEVGETFVEEVPRSRWAVSRLSRPSRLFLQKVREAERDRQFEEFKDRAGTIINGWSNAKSTATSSLMWARAKRSLRRNEKIGRESYRPNDRIRCYIKDVRREAARPADFPEPDSARVHGRAVQDGSARDLRRHHRDQSCCA